jgi:hypothetical protein
MRTDSKIEQWREQNAPRLIYGMVVLVNVLVLLRAFGLLTNVGPSTEFLGGLCVGSWIGLAVFHLSGGALPMRKLSKARANAGSERAINAAGPRPMLQEPSARSSVPAQNTPVSFDARAGER